jgi:hypothetical protein
MSRISMILLSGALAVLALPTKSANAGTVQTPKVTVHTPAPPKLNNATSVIQYRNGAQYPMSRKPGRTRFDPITLNRGVTSDQSLQQWEQGIGGTR